VLAPNTSGTVVNPQSAIGNRLGFQGRTNFGELGLQYFRNSPDLGRFISSDPLGMVDGPNTYGFCGGDPVNRVDPMGRSGGSSRNGGCIMAMLAKRHVFEHEGQTYVIAPDLISENPMTYSLSVTRGKPQTQQGPFGRFRNIWGQRFSAWILLDRRVSVR
jgi:RHS repeat-associated protein